MNLLGKVDLAHERDFVLGRLTVSPSRRQLVRDDGEHVVIEHRVMQVLVALSKAEGAILTRDELVMFCWDGRVVGDDAIHRVMSRLRKVAGEIGAGSFEIETITKIGYRLVRNDCQAAGDGHRANHDQTPLPVREPPADRGRRSLVVGAAAIGALGAAGSGAYLYRRVTGPSVPPEVDALITHARQLRSQNTREAQAQAIGLMRRVVTIAPRHADGWGMLGCAYAIPSHYRDQAEGLALRARAETAGRRALELDPGNAYGELALAMAMPFIGHWTAIDRRLERALADRPDDEDVLGYRALTLMNVGRFREAVTAHRKIRLRPLSPAAFSNYINALWGAGMLEETDHALADAAALYPAHTTIWVSHFHIKMFGGDPQAAIALAQDDQGRPDGIDGPTLEAWLAQAHAIASSDPAQVKAVVAAQLERARLSAFGAAFAVRVLSALRQVDAAFAVAGAYFFGHGFTVPDQPTPGSKFTPSQRQTRLLFEPVTRPLRSDPRFERLVAAIGLEQYWRKSRIQPDYRR